MNNLRMQEKINSGEALDLSACRRTLEDYILEYFEDDVDYCDALQESWIWSIGRNRANICLNIVQIL